MHACSVGSLQTFVCEASDSLLGAFVYTTSRIFTSVPLSSMLEKATQVKKQKQPLCRISNTRKERVDEDVRGARRFTCPAHPQVAVGSAHGGAFRASVRGDYGQGDQ